MAAAVGAFPTNEEALYLQPYRQPSWFGTTIPFPAFEMLGPFVGHVVTQPRLRSQDYPKAAEALWTAMEELLRDDEQQKDPLVLLPVDDPTNDEL